MRFHVLGVSFAPTNREYSCEGFSQKVRLFCKMMYELGHEVYHYGVEGSEPICTENINVVSKETYDKVHKSYDFKKSGFLYYSDTEAQHEFNLNAIIEIQKRKKPHDFLCCSFGFPQKPVVDAHPDIIPCEIGIGFDGSVVPHRIFESYAWMHTIYGKEGKLQSPSFYDAVIPNYYDLDDYIYSKEKDDYFFFIARLEPLKGLEIALRSAEYVGSKLIVAGVGTPHLTSPNLLHIGVVDFEERAKLMSRARATFVPTNYIEPFGSTVIESMLCGTPVISTDFGAFTETVIHGLTGYRCRTLEQFYWATKNIDKIKPIDCRNYAVNNYSMSRISEMYQEYFMNLYKLSTNNEEGWYQKNPSRKNLNHLIKYIPEIKKPEDDTRPILVFHIGYTPDINNEQVIEKYGSEITLVKLAEQFSKKYRVFIFGSNLVHEIVKNDVEYLNSKRFREFQQNNNIDIVIFSRYIYNIIDYEIKSRKTFIWVHDTHILPYYQSVEFPNYGRGFLKNILHKIDGIITLTDWHKKYFLEYYNIDPKKVFVISSAIDIKMFNNNIKKQKNKFIWTSHGLRGLDKLVEYFHEIRVKIPDAELYVYRGEDTVSNEIIEEMNKYNYIHYGGKLRHDKLIEEFETSEIWFYPTHFVETYCMSAVEAQMAKCVCVATDIAALNEIIDNRGVLINEELYSEEYKQKCIDEIVNILTNDEIKIKYQNAGHEWAINQTWENRAKQWYELFDKK